MIVLLIISSIIFKRFTFSKIWGDTNNMQINSDLISLIKLTDEKFYSHEDTKVQRNSASLSELPPVRSMTSSRAQSKTVRRLHST